MSARSRSETVPEGSPARSESEEACGEKEEPGGSPAKMRSIGGVRLSPYRLGYSVRIPCAWAMGHVSGPDECVVDAAWLNRVQQLVDWCLEENLYVIINQHWDGGWLEHDGVTDSADVATKQKQLASIWRQIAQRF